MKIKHANPGKFLYNFFYDYQLKISEQVSINAIHSIIKQKRKMEFQNKLIRFFQRMQVAQQD